MLDTLLATISAGVPLALAVLGIYVTWQPPEIPSKKHDIMIICFVVLGLLGVACAGAVAYRSGRQLDRIETNTGNPPKVEVNVPPSTPPQVTILPPTPTRHVSTGFIKMATDPQFADGGNALAEASPLSVNIRVMNGGAEPVDGFFRYFEISLQPVTTETADKVDATMLATFKKNAKKMAKSVTPEQKHTVDPGTIDWNTLTTQALTKAQVDGINNGTLRFYVYALASWKDEAHDFEYCVSLQPPKTPQLNVNAVWHNCVH